MCLHHIILDWAIDLTPRKNPNKQGRGVRIARQVYFFESYLFLPSEIPKQYKRKLDFTPGNSGILCDIPGNSKQDQKLRPMEIPNEFFLNNLGNSTSFLIVTDCWNFHLQ